MSRPATRARSGAARSIAVVSVLALPVGLAWSAFPSAGAGRIGSGPAAVGGATGRAASDGGPARRCSSVSDAVGPAAPVHGTRIGDAAAVRDRSVAEHPGC